MKRKSFTRAMLIGISVAGFPLNACSEEPGLRVAALDANLQPTGVKYGPLFSALVGDILAAGEIKTNVPSCTGDPVSYDEKLYWMSSQWLCKEMGEALNDKSGLYQMASTLRNFIIVEMKRSSVDASAAAASTIVVNAMEEIITILRSTVPADRGKSNSGQNLRSVPTPGRLVALEDGLLANELVYGPLFSALVSDILKSSERDRKEAIGDGESVRYNGTKCRLGFKYLYSDQGDPLIDKSGKYAIASATRFYAAVDVRNHGLDTSELDVAQLVVNTIEKVMKTLNSVTSAVQKISSENAK